MRICITLEKNYNPSSFTYQNKKCRFCRRFEYRLYRCVISNGRITDEFFVCDNCFIKKLKGEKQNG